jgi:hypothetical protein
MLHNTIECPNCKTVIDVNEILYKKLSEELSKKHLEEEKKLKEEIASKEKALSKTLMNIEEKEKSIKDRESKFSESLEVATKVKLKEQTEALKSKLKQQLEEEQQESMALMKKELEEKSIQVKELNKSRVEIEQLKREKDEITSKVKADAQIEISKKIQEERAKIEKSSRWESELKLKEKEEQLKQLKEQLQIAHRKAEQGSMQLQGEAQELALEEYLSNRFKLDNIEEIAKGVRGADCLQTIHTRDSQNCGKIYYESKRTKDFQKQWIEKFKIDIREKGADIGVLVTQALPKDQERMSLIDGIWICTYDEFKSLCVVLRESLVKIDKANRSQENKTDKMSLLYGFLTSNEFSMQVEAIVEGFSTMKSDLDKEKRAMAKIWKQREKQLDKVLDNTVNMYGSIKGIAGNAIVHVEALELPYEDEEE